MAKSINYNSSRLDLDKIKTSLIDFILEHTSSGGGAGGGGQEKQDIIDTLDDEIILSYVSNVLQDELEGSVFDVDEFTEMLSAYFPLFQNIPKDKVTLFVNTLINNTQRINQVKIEEEKKFEEIISKMLLTSAEPAEQKGRSRQDSSSSVDLEQKPRTISISSSTNSDIEEDLSTLLEMFPSILLSRSEAGSIIAFCAGDLERAVQILLLAQEDIHSLQDEDKIFLQNNLTHFFSNKTQLIWTFGKKEPPDEKVLKERLVARYGYIDKAQDAKEFRPLLPKEEPKKLVRYREGQVVSTKGERFTEVAVNKDGEEVKIRTYISKSHKQLQQMH